MTVTEACEVLDNSCLGDLLFMTREQLEEDIGENEELFILKEDDNIEPVCKAEFINYILEIQMAIRQN